MQQQTSKPQNPGQQDQNKAPGKDNQEPYKQPFEKEEMETQKKNERDVERDSEESRDDKTGAA